MHRAVDKCLTNWKAYSCTRKQDEVFQAVNTLLKTLRHGMLHTAISTSQPPALHQQQQQKLGLSRNGSTEAQSSTVQHGTAHPVTGREKAITSRRSCGATGSHSTTQGRLPPIALACSQATGGTSTSSAASTPDAELSSDPSFKTTQTVNDCCSNEGRY